MVAGASVCFYYEPVGFDVSEIMLRQAPVRLKIDPSKTACSVVPIANSVCPRDLGTVHVQ